MDAFDSKTLDTHHVFAEAGVAILENLVLTAVPPGEYTLIALPLKLTDADGSPVRAVHDGTIAYAGPFTGYGTLVIIDHGNETISLYGQLGDAQVERDAKVERGDAVGTAGRVLVGIPGIYFEMRVDGKPVDPLEWLKKR